MFHTVNSRQYEIEEPLKYVCFSISAPEKDTVVCQIYHDIFSTKMNV